MKTKLTILALLLTLSVKAQTIGDHLDFIQVERLGGELREYSDGFTYEYYDQAAQLTWLFFCDTDSLCDKIMIHPEEPQAQDSFVAWLDVELNKVEQNIWSLKRDDGSMIIVALMGDDQNGRLFIVNEVK